MRERLPGGRDCSGQPDRARARTLSGHQRRPLLRCSNPGGPIPGGPGTASALGAHLEAEADGVARRGTGARGNRRFRPVCDVCRRRTAPVPERERHHPREAGQTVRSRPLRRCARSSLDTQGDGTLRRDRTRRSARHPSRQRTRSRHHLGRTAAGQPRRDLCRGSRHRPAAPGSRCGSARCGQRDRVRRLVQRAPRLRRPSIRPLVAAGGDHRQRQRRSRRRAHPRDRPAAAGFDIHLTDRARGVAFVEGRRDRRRRAPWSRRRRLHPSRTDRAGRRGCRRHARPRCARRCERNRANRPDCGGQAAITGRAGRSSPAHRPEHQACVPPIARTLRV